MEPSLTEALQEMVHRSEKPPKVISDETGIPYNYLMRQVLEGESGCNFILKNLVPVMKASGNFDPLKVLNMRCGFLPPVKAPRGTKQGAKTDLNDYQISFNKMMQKIIRFIQDPTDDNFKAVDLLMRDHMSDTECIRRKCKKNLINQTELF